MTLSAFSATSATVEWVSEDAKSKRGHFSSLLTPMLNTSLVTPIFTCKIEQSIFKVKTHFNTPPNSILHTPTFANKFSC